MSKELLIQARDALASCRIGWYKDIDGDFCATYRFDKKLIETALAALQAAIDAPEPEPVMIYHGRCIIDCGDGGHQDVTMLKMIPAGSRLFTRPAPAKPMPDGWMPIATAPKDGTLVVVYSPNGPDDWPDSFKVAFDYFCQDYENWFYHSEAHEHYMAIGGSNACGPDVSCTGPKQEAPYTHWMPLPAAPKEPS